jgi:DMSO/TMAO reductase YedYZ heme-binding membrane subunit
MGVDYKISTMNVSWHIRKIRGLIYIAVFLTTVAIGASAYVQAPDLVQFWVAAREYYGMAALGFLLASVAAGPLNYVAPWLPIRAHLALGRRALGVSAFILAGIHAACYLGPTVVRNWRGLWSPGRLWISGLLLGAGLFVNMGVLAYTSRDKAVRELGPKRWKTLHRSVYIVLPGVLIHAILLGADFGVTRGPDVVTEPDDGCLIGFSVAFALWLLLFFLRKRRIRLG